jgi:drug/metabolite transporter (DMT)-like permease
MTGLWAVYTVAGAAGQTARNAMQRELTASLGAVGATHVRFLFGFPFALLFLSATLVATHASLPATNPTFWFWIVAGALTQIGGTALMLLTMTERSFVVTIAYLKSEPLFVAGLGLVLLHDPLSWTMAVAILIATTGVVLMSVRPNALTPAGAGLRPALLGLASGALFAVSAIGYRGAIQALHAPGTVLGATFALSVGLVMQAALLSAWLGVRKPATLAAIVRLWRPSLLAGFTGAAASEFWFLAFALATAASVRTLGLVDVLFAQIVSHIAFKQKTSAREAAGIVLLVGGAALLVWSHP